MCRIPPHRLTPYHPRVAESRLREAVGLALAEREWGTCSSIALRLAQACGLAREEECAKWLCLYQCCVAHVHWLRVWREACDPRDRFALLASVVSFLGERWAVPASFSAMGDAKVSPP